MLILLAAQALATSNSAAASAAAKPADCSSASPSQIVVCGEAPERSRYRMDSAIAEIERRREGLGTRPPAHQSIGQEPCPPSGLKLCPGLDTIPVLAIARVAAQSALLAAAGEDWRTPLRTQADQYEEYRESKIKADRRRSERKVRVSLFPSRNR